MKHELRFVPLQDVLNQASAEKNLSEQDINRLLDSMYRPYVEQQAILHFETSSGALGPGRLIDYDFERRTVSIQIRGEAQVREVLFADINDFGPAAYDNPKTTGETLLGIFWDARVARKQLERFVAHSYARLSPEEVDSFKDIQKVTATDVHSIVPLLLPEAEVKRSIAEILGYPFVQKDWGGELCDLYCDVRFRSRSVPAAFLLKGASYADRPLRVAHLGKNGDQLVRLFSLEAELYVVQSNGPIDPTVFNHVQAHVAEKLMSNQAVYYLIMDGTQTARLLRAYGKV